MASLKRAPSVVCILVLTFLTAGCDGRAEPEIASTPTETSTQSSSGSSVPSPSLTPQTPRNRAASHAAQVLRDYYRLTDRLQSDPRVSISQLSRLAAGRELAEESSLIRSERRRGRKLMGKTQIVHLTVTSVDLAHKPKQKPPRIPQVEISICYDVSGVDMVNKDGRSVVLASRKDRAVANYGVANFDWPDPRGWKVTWSDVRGKPCPA